MVAFDVQDMHCGHCVRAITEAVHAVDAAASVQVDLAAHRVQVEATSASPDAIVAAIRDAGYSPVPLARR